MRAQRPGSMWRRDHSLAPVAHAGSAVPAASGVSRPWLMYQTMRTLCMLQTHGATFSTLCWHQCCGPSMSSVCLLARNNTSMDHLFRELFDDPLGPSVHVGGEQIGVAHPPLRVAHHHHLDWAITQDVRPQRLVTDHQKFPCLAIDGHRHLLPLPTVRFLVRSRGRLAGLGQTWPFFALGPRLPFGFSGNTRVVQGSVVHAFCRRRQPAWENRGASLCRHSRHRPADEAALGKPGQHLEQHFAGQVGTTGLTLPGRCKRCHQGQCQDGHLGERGCRGPGRRPPSCRPLAVATRFCVEATARATSPGPRRSCPACGSGCHRPAIRN